MKEFHFTKIYFNKTIYEDSKSNVRVEVRERPSINLKEEEYSLRVTTRYEGSKMIHRNYAIEHHNPPAKHSFPHLQFKFHTEEIGQFRLRIDVKNQDEYRKVVLGFIYKIKNTLKDLEKFSKGITRKIMIINLVNQLEKEGGFLDKKISQGIQRYSIEFDGKRKQRNSFKKLKENPLLLDFIGIENIESVEKEYVNENEPEFIEKIKKIQKQKSIRVKDFAKRYGLK